MKEEKIVAIPGPTPVIEAIRQEMGREIQAFGDPRFVQDYKDLIQGLAELLVCDGQAFPLAGSGTLAMEMAVANSSRPGDELLIVSHGFFGDRFIDICQRKGRKVDIISSDWGRIVPVEEIRAQLDRKPYKAILVTQVDTSTGVRAPVEAIGELLQDYPDTLYILDGVAATGGEYTDMRAMKIDILFTGSQKAFGVPPGMFVLWANEKALQRRQELGQISEYYVDYQQWLPVMKDPARYFATPAVNLVWAMKKAMEIMRAEGMEARASRHRIYGQALQAAFERLGFRILAEKDHRTATLSCLIYPEGVEDTAFRAAMYEEGMVIAGALADYAGRACRIGHMGNIDDNYFTRLLSAVEKSLNICGMAVQPGSGLEAFKEALKG